MNYFFFIVRLRLSGAVFLHRCSAEKSSYFGTFIVLRTLGENEYNWEEMTLSNYYCPPKCSASHNKVEKRWSRTSLIIDILKKDKNSTAEIDTLDRKNYLAVFSFFLLCNRNFASMWNIFDTGISDLGAKILKKGSLWFF